MPFIRSSERIYGLGVEIIGWASVVLNSDSIKQFLFTAFRRLFFYGAKCPRFLQSLLSRSLLPVWYLCNFDCASFPFPHPPPKDPPLTKTGIRVQVSVGGGGSWSEKPLAIMKSILDCAYS